MTEASVLPEHPRPEDRPVGHRAARPKRRSGCLPMLLVLAVVVAVGAAAWFKVISPWWDDMFGEPDDFAGPGHGNLCFVVMEGDSVSSVGDRLEEEGVVASSDAFSDAAETDGASVFPGTYGLKKEMDAGSAVGVLSDLSNSGCVSALTFLPGKTVDEVVKLLAQNTDFSRADYQKVLDRPDALGLPPAADGNAEGYLAPGSYEVDPKDTPRSILKAMVDRWRGEAEDLRLEAKAADLGYDVHDMMTIASLVEAEGSTLDAGDKAKIARAIYNRLEDPTAETAGFLQIDATIAYAVGGNPGVALTQEQLDIDSPYNTRKYKGLPPGPIAAPSASSIDAALNPAGGDWLYWVTVDLKTGETKFSETHEEFLDDKAEYTAYCETSDAC